MPEAEGRRLEANDRWPKAEGQGPRAKGRVLESIQELASWLYRQQILPAPMAIFNKLCEILDRGYMRYM